MIAQQQLEYKAVHSHLIETKTMLNLIQELPIITIKKIHLYKLNQLFTQGKRNCICALLAA